MVQTRVASLLALLLEVASQPRVANQKSYNDIICPFLSTLIHEQAIPIQDYYEQDELMAVVLNAGLTPEETVPHIHAQFRNIRSDRIDIFNMEGLPDEHFTSSGINDCNTDYSHWDQCPVGPEGSSTQGVRVCKTDPCTLPNPFQQVVFLNHFDPDTTGHLTVSNLKLLAESWTDLANDVNYDPGVEGKIEDAYTFLMHVFKNGADSLTYTDFDNIVMQRHYPAGYTFGRGCNTADRQNHQQDFPRYPAYPFGIQDSYGRWLSLSGPTGVVMTSDMTVWTAEQQNVGYGLRASGPSTREAGLWLQLDSNGVLSGHADHVTSWKAVQSKDKVFLQAVECNGAPCGGFLSSDAHGNVQMSSAASVNEMFSLVYCALPPIPGPTPVPSPVPPSRRRSPSPSPPPTCTAAYRDPYSSGKHVPCCTGSEYYLKFETDKAKYHKCIPFQGSVALNIDCPGSDLSDQPVDTSDECGALCAGTGSCHAYTHNVLDGHGAPHCYLKTGCKKLEDGSGSNSTTGILGVDILTGGWCDGNDIDPDGKAVSTLTACVEFCKGTPGCQWFTFRGDGICYVKTSCSNYKSGTSYHTSGYLVQDYRLNAAFDIQAAFV